MTISTESDKKLVTGPRTAEIFICYRRGDGSVPAELINQLLSGHEFADANGDPCRIDVYFDQAAPGVGDWKLHLLPALQTAKALVVICTPGLAKDFSTAKESDWAYEELRWWIARRNSPPIVIDTICQGERWLPEPIVRKWPNLNRIDFERERLAGPAGEEYAQRLRARIVGTIREHEQATTHEDLERYRRRTRQFAVATVLLGIASVGALAALGLAKYNERRAQAQEQVANDAMFLIADLFAKADPDNTFGESLTVSQVLVAGRAHIDRIAAEKGPLVTGRLLQAIGSAYIGLGEFDTAIALLGQAQSTLTGLSISPESRFHLNHSLGEAHLQLDQYEAAKRYLDIAIDVAGRYALGAAESSAANVSMGDYHAWSPHGDIERAKFFYGQALATDRATSSAINVARDLNRLGSLAYQQEDYEGAKALYLEAISTVNDLSGGARVLLLAQYKNDFAGVYYQQGELETAGRLYAEAAERFEAVYGATSGEAAVAANNQARVLIERDELQRVPSLLLGAVESQRNRFGPKFSQLSFSLHNLGIMEQLNNNIAAARKLFQEAHEIANANNLAIGGQSLVHLAELSLDESKLTDAADWLQRADAYFKEREQADGWRYALYESAKGELEARRCNFGSAGALLSSSAEELRSRWPNGNLFTRSAQRRQSMLDRLMARPGRCH